MTRIEQLRQLCWQTAGVDRVVQGLRQALQQVQAEESWLEQQPLLQLVKDLDHAQTLELGDSSRRNLNLLLDPSSPLANQPADVGSRAVPTREPRGAFSN